MGRREGGREGGRDGHVPSSAAEIEGVGHEGQEGEDEEGSGLREEGREGGRGVSVVVADALSRPSLAPSLPPSLTFSASMYKQR